MKEFIAKLKAVPAIAAMIARDDFTARHCVPLPIWVDLDRATGWCEHRWRTAERKYRRRVQAADRIATFEFPNPADALAFRLAAQKRFRCY